MGTFSPLSSLFDNMGILDRVTDVAFLVVAYPIVMLYLYIYNDGCATHTLEAGEAITRREKAVKTAMKERKKNEPEALRAGQEEITMEQPQTKTVTQFFGLRKQIRPRSVKEQKSPLFRLPLEIREQIYSEVLGGNTLHITQLPGRLGHVRCTSTQSPFSDNNIICTRDCFHPNRVVQTYRHGEFLDLSAESDDSLSLLRTCRQVYIESSRVLYETSTFDFNHPQTLNFFARSLRPSRLASIRYINLTWSGVLPFIENEPLKAPDDMQTWKQAWHTIGIKMSSLRTLRMRMHIYDDEIEKSRTGPFLLYARKRWTSNDAQFEKLLEDMKQNVRGLRQFRLGIELPEEINWDVCSLEKRLQEIVCSPRVIPTSLGSC